MTAAGPMPPQQPAKKSNTVLIIVIVVAVVGLMGIALVGVMASLGIHGFRKYISASKEAEARNGVAQLAGGVADCAESRGADDAVSLPRSTRPVPDSLSKISGKKYMSSTTDWDEPAFKCAAFRMTSPQYFQYQWVLAPSGLKGTARASGDLDGDGTAEVVFELDVDCVTGACRVGAPVRETRR